MGAKRAFMAASHADPAGVRQKRKYKVSLRVAAMQAQEINFGRSSTTRRRIH